MSDVRFVRCRWVRDKETGERFHVPECWGGVYNPKNCCCPRPTKTTDPYQAIKRALSILSDRKSMTAKELASVREVLRAGLEN